MEPIFLYFSSIFNKRTIISFYPTIFVSIYPLDSSNLLHLSNVFRNDTLLTSSYLIPNHLEFLPPSNLQMAISTTLKNETSPRNNYGWRVDNRDR